MVVLATGSLIASAGFPHKAVTVQANPVLKVGIHWPTLV
jgi:hypothetical protein